MFDLQLAFFLAAMVQLDLFGFDTLSVTEKQRIFSEIRNQYFFLRNLRKWRPNEKRRRAIYRKIEGQKKRMRLAGVSKTEILLFLSCCRQRCKLGKKCSHCAANYV